MKAYVLLDTHPRTKVEETLAKLHAMDVVSAEAVVGDYDFIIIIEGTQSKIKSIISKRIEKLEGFIATKVHYVW